MEGDQDNGDNRQAMKRMALFTREKLDSLNPVDVQNAPEEYAALVDQFYQENEAMMAPQQYEAAKKDFEYFMRLVDLAYHYFEDMEGKGTQSLH